MRATAYSLDGVMYNGEEVKDGACALSNVEYIGSVIVMYQRLPGDKLGKCIGMYEICDTGCKAHVVDVWKPKNECQAFMDEVYKDGCDGKVFVQIIRAEG